MAKLRLIVIWGVLLSMMLATGTALAQDAVVQTDTGLVVALRHTHSLVRWLVVIAAVAAVVKLALGLVQKSDFDSLTRRIMLAFSGLITLQWLIGLIFLVVYGSAVGFGLRHFWEHLVVMTIAVGLSHMHNRFKSAAAPTRYRNTLLLVIGVLGLVFVGVALLPQGWRLFPA
jgi:hypothetical protein